MGIFFGKRDRVLPEGLGDGAARQAEGAVDAPYIYPGRGPAELMPQKVIGEKELAQAAGLLQEYKRGKANLERRVIEDELWWELRHWEALRRGQKKEGALPPSPEPASAWLFNSILNKHADAMDNYPEAVVLPRESSDQESATVLSEVLPVIMEYNDFEKTYSDNWWEKLKHGTAVYGIFWNSEKENGLGDVDIRQIDLLKIFWEPGVTNVQDSRNLFIVELTDVELLEQQYPEHKGKLAGRDIDVAQYVYDDTVDTSDKAVVVDWYYKTRVDGRTVVHFAKFVGSTLLYASENDPEYRERGFYDHGMYPVVFDVLWPEKGTPCGFGYVAVCKDPQLYIDKLGGNILENSMMVTKKRYFVSDSTNINEEEFLDWTRPIVHVAGDLADNRVREITGQPLNDIYVAVMNNKIEEMKDTAANRDVNSGGTGSGVTAASAIAALQEAGNKASRDMISASYRAHVAISSMCIELIRQFYDETRSFRITNKPTRSMLAALQQQMAGGVPGEVPAAPAAPAGEYSFVELSNAGLKDQPVGTDAAGNELYRRPVFDLKVKAQKKNPFSRMEQNEIAKELYAMGFFNPDKAQESSIAIGMMDFEGVEDIREKISEGNTLYNAVQQLMQENQQLKAALFGAPAGPAGAASPAPAGGGGGGGGLTAQLSRSRQPQSGYTQNLVKRSVPDMSMASDAANPAR